MAMVEGGSVIAVFQSVDVLQVTGQGSSGAKAAWPTDRSVSMSLGRDLDESRPVVGRLDELDLNVEDEGR
jgi:hypothetical protein